MSLFSGCGSPTGNANDPDNVTSMVVPTLTVQVGTPTPSSMLMDIYPNSNGNAAKNDSSRNLDPADDGGTPGGEVIGPNSTPNGIVVTSMDSPMTNSPNLTIPDN